MIFDIVEYGSKAGENFLNTKAIQKAVDCCHDHGGGRLYFELVDKTKGSVYAVKYNRNFA